MQTISVPQLAWHEPKNLELALPDSWQAKFYNMAGYNRPAMKSEEIKTSLSKLIGTAPIRELARGKKQVAILFDDLTRVTRVAEIVPFVLEELAQAGIPDSKIRFIAALGCHGALDRFGFAKKLGESTLARFPVYNHNAHGNCTYVGTTKTFGTEVYINEEVMKCDLKIGIGSLVPHPLRGFGGFSGGGKIILPGVSSFNTVKHNHETASKYFREKRSQPTPGMEVFGSNLMRADIEEIAALAGLDVKIDCLINGWGETVEIFAGAVIPTYLAAVDKAKDHYLSPKGGGEPVIIANTFAKASEAVAGLNIAFKALGSRGGDVILIANAPQGQVTHFLHGPFGNIVKPQRSPLIPQSAQNLNHLIMYSEYPDLTRKGRYDEAGQVLFLHKWDDVLQVLKKVHGADTHVAVFPNADIQYCV
jgi:lactate racemase